jgi:hypothetical protein
MTSLDAPTAISQLSEGNLGWNCCGEADVWSVMRTFGQTGPGLGTVTAEAIALGASGNGETSMAALVALLDHYGIPASAGSGPLANSIPAALGRGHYIIVLVTSDSDGNPTAGKAIGHWLLAYSDDSGGNYLVMNPLGSPPGQLSCYPQALLQACDRGKYVEVDVVAPGNNPPVLPPAPVPVSPAPPAPPKEPPDVILTVFYATPKAGPPNGPAAVFLSEDLEHFRWIQSEAELTDILALAAAQGVTVEQHTPGVPVADVAAFGDPEDVVTATILGLPFP